MPSQDFAEDVALDPLTTQLFQGQLRVAYTAFVRALTYRNGRGNIFLMRWFEVVDVLVVPARGNK
jgi:hypothetical protein